MDTLKYGYDQVNPAPDFHVAHFVHDLGRSPHHTRWRVYAFRDVPTGIVLR